MYNGFLYEGGILCTVFLLHCKECHHEWESSEKVGICDWCGAGSYLLQEHHFDLSKILKILIEHNKIKEKINE